MSYYLGLDAGGTKTFCLIGDERGNVIGFGRAGSGNYETAGIEPAAHENRKAIEGALAEAKLPLHAISAIGMGIAGADLPEDYVMLEREIYTPLFGGIPRDFQNDSMAGLRGGTRSPFGIVIACGTGCVCAGKNPAGEHVRTGGLGEEFGDECAGSSIGRLGIQRVFQARDGVIGETLLTRKFVERAGCADVDDLFHRLYRRQLTCDDLQPMAKLVFDAAFEGDRTSCDILESGGMYLGKMVNATARKLRMNDIPFEVVMAGSVFKGRSPVLIDALQSEIRRECPSARPVMPLFEPVVGALLMGMEVNGGVSADVYDNLSSRLLDAERRYNVRFRTE